MFIIPEGYQHPQQPEEWLVLGDWWEERANQEYSLLCKIWADPHSYLEGPRGSGKTTARLMIAIKQMLAETCRILYITPKESLAVWIHWRCRYILRIFTILYSESMHGIHIEGSVLTFSSTTITQGHTYDYYISNQVNVDSYITLSDSTRLG